MIDIGSYLMQTPFFNNLENLEFIVKEGLYQWVQNVDFLVGHDYFFRNLQTIVKYVFDSIGIFIDVFYGILRDSMDPVKIVFSAFGIIYLFGAFDCRVEVYII